MLFMLNEAILFKDGQGTTTEANYLGPVDHQNGLKHKIIHSDGKEFLVDGIFLSPIQAPDVASVPIEIEQFASELPNLSKIQLEQIAHPEILDSDQRELMALHCKMNHLPFPALIRLAESGKIKKRLANLKERLPVCMSCIFGMSHRRPWRSRGAPNTIRKKSETEPGDCVSIDQIVSAQPGLIPQMAGFLTNMRIWGATVFVDHVSDFVYVALMRDLTLDETLLAKTSFERLAKDGGVRIKAYRADNGRFADKGFRDSVEECNQQITYCAVGAHHQNGIVERRIKELTLIARTLLLHAVRHWPGYVTTMMWPFALKEAAYRLNRLTIDSDGRSNEAKFFGVDHDFVDPALFHVFGSPCFVLDARLQSGPAGVPKWEPRSRLGIYVGHSPSHAGSVALVLNPRTGHVSPQFHVVFDDTFSTVPFMDQSQVPSNWSDLVENSRELVTDEQYELANTWLTDTLEQNTATVQQEQPSNAISKIVPSTHLPAVTDVETDTSDAVPLPNYVPDQEPDISDNRPLPDDTTPSRRVHFEIEHSTSQVCEGEELPSNEAPRMINLETSGLRRSERIRNQTQNDISSASNGGPNIRAYAVASRNERPFARTSKKKQVSSYFSMFMGIGALWSFATLSMPHFYNSQCHSYVARISNDYERLNGLFDDTINDVIHHVKAFSTTNEAFTYKQMLKEDDYRDFFKAMIDEIEVHEKRDHWTLMERKDLPIGTKTIMAIWSFKRKRYPDGSLNKHKARLCAHGGQQTWGQDYWDTYAPVVTWASVRMLLIVAKIHKLESKSIDFVLAFPQADLDVPVFMELPSGVTPIDEIDDNRRRYVLRLNKSLYGLKQAGHNWFEKLRSGLQDRDFLQSRVDSCVFYKEGCIVLTYVDDCIIIGKNMAIVDSVIQSLRDGQEDFELTDEGSIDKYLGVMIKDIDDSSFEMSQPFLTRRVIQFLSLDENKT